MHILYNLFVLLTWNTPRFCAGCFDSRGNSQRSSLQLFSSPPQADIDAALKELYGHFCKQETVHPDAVFIITGDFNKADLRRIAPKFLQHISCNTRGEWTLDHCYSPFRNAYKSLPHPPLGKSDHSSVLLLPAYRQKLKRETPALRMIQLWSDQSDSMLQDCFDYVDWKCSELHTMTKSMFTQTQSRAS